MKSLTVRLPDQLVKEIEAESRERDCAKSDIVRERLQRGAGSAASSSARPNLIADLIGSVDGLPAGRRLRTRRPGIRARQCCPKPTIYLANAAGLP